MSEERTKGKSRRGNHPRTYVRGPSSAPTANSAYERANCIRYNGFQGGNHIIGNAGLRQHNYGGERAGQMIRQLRSSVDHDGASRSDASAQNRFNVPICQIDVEDRSPNLLLAEEGESFSRCAGWAHDGPTRVLNRLY